MSYLIIESGSTKTDWCLLRKSKKAQRYTTSGINPFLQSTASIAETLEKELPLSLFKNSPEHICYYGSGAATKPMQREIQTVLEGHFGTKSIEVNGDLMAAARALCGDKKGIVCILGTGSSSAYYDGNKIKDRQPSLGYIAGDEGSGNHMGKRVLRYYAYGTFDAELKMDFEMRFGADLQAIIYKLYNAPYPNRLLASFVSLLIENRGHYMVENIVEDCLNDFFQSSILKYRQSWLKPLYFTGSIAYYFRDVVLSLCEQYELEPGIIEQSPMDGLIRFHKAML